MKEVVEEIKRVFRILERNVLLLIGFPLPVFAISYLYIISGELELDLPKLSWIFDFLVLGLVIFLLILQAQRFNAQIRSIRIAPLELIDKIKAYGNATIAKFWLLFWVGLLCAAGLLFFENPGFTIAYAINLIFTSLGKPTPDRIVSALRLKGRDREIVFEINRRGE
jgi:hypothetical protein